MFSRHLAQQPIFLNNERMHDMKKFISLLIVLSLILCMLSISVFAAQYDDCDDVEIVAAWRVEDGEIIPISIEEYYDLLRDTYTPKNDDSTYQMPDSMFGEYNDDRINIKSGVVSTTFSFAKTSETVFWGASEFVSACVEGPGTITASSSVTTTASFSISLTGAAKTKILNSASANVGLSVSSGTGNTSGASFSVPSGKFGKISFSPKYVTVIGDLTTIINYEVGVETFTDTVTSTLPVKLNNGLADGLYKLEVRNSSF